MIDPRELADAITDDAEAFFRVSRIDLDERLVQALSLTDDDRRENAPSSIRVLRQAIQVQPSLAYGFQRAGVDLSRLEDRPGYEYDCDPDVIWFHHQFDLWFKHPADGSPCAEFKRVRAEGRLSCASIMRACLETLYISDEYLRYGESFRDVNDIFGSLAIACGARSTIEAASTDLPLRLRQVIDDAVLVDESAGSQQFLMVLEGNRIRIHPMAAFGTHLLGESPLRDGGLWVARSNVLQPSAYFSPESLQLLEDLINSDANELVFQSFFEQHPEYITALGGYSAIRSHLVMTLDDGRKLVPPTSFLRSSTLL